MMKGRKIQIIPSAALNDWKINKLAGRKGVLLSVKIRKNNSGCWVRLYEPYCDEIEWFIPIQSIQLTTNTDGSTNR